jgi:hypothetical protein
VSPDSGLSAVVSVFPLDSVPVSAAESVEVVELLLEEDEEDEPPPQPATARASALMSRDMRTRRRTITSIEST